MTKEKKLVGFAKMKADGKSARVSELARLGGQAAHARGVAHQFDSASARAAGSKGGRAVHQRRRKVEEAGRDGG